MAKQMFVDNDRLKREYEEYRKTPEAVAYFEARDKHRADKEGGVQNGLFKLKPPPLPEYIAVSIYKIANSYGTKPNFRHLHNVDEMVTHAIITALSYGHNYDPRMETSAFGYLTMVIDRAFIASIHQTRHQKKIEREVIMRAATGQIDSVVGGGQGVTTTTYVNLMAKHYDDAGILEQETQAMKKPKPEKLPKPKKQAAVTASLEGVFDE